MNKIIATVSGKIQNVGYRAKVIGIAKDFGLTGFVLNLDDGRVRIIAEGKNGDFGKFLDAIRIKNTLIDVADVEVEHADATGDLADFYKLVGEGETDERLDKASDYLKELIEVMRAGFGSLESKMDVMIEKQDVMIDETRGLREDLKGYMDMKFGKIDGELDLIKGALKERGIL
ncbi:MAG: acylphosphatase [Candidatus Methanogaster sp.]|uniref:Acylphosphatase n=1 Tax=Candidatus Methanogaster sp. TaxID=3386292 RepID=A0AC61L6J4_9EURY|nr:MAG: acylphosphatase [ANME-2 cluster archaeon]